MNLLRFELRKLKCTKSLYICLLIAIILMSLNMYMTHTFSGDISLESVQSSMKNYASSSMLIMLLGIFTSLYTCEDYSSNTMKNIIAKGYSRKEVFLVKYISVTIVTIIYNLVLLIVSYIIGSILYENVAIPEYFVISFIVQILLIISYNTIFYAISMIFSKTSTSMSLNIIGPTLLALILNIFDSIIKLKDFKLSNYHLDHLINTMSGMLVERPQLFISACISLCIMLFSLYIGMVFMKRKEIC